MQTSRAIPLHPDVHNGSGPSRIVACIDHTGISDHILPHAFAMGEALGAPVTLLQVLEARTTQEFRPDPIEWDIRRREVRGVLKKLAVAQDEGAATYNVELVEGDCADEINRWTKGKPETLIVLGTRSRCDKAKSGLGSTARNVIEGATGPILLVPVASRYDPAPRYRRLLVPLDGSSWAESVVPLAVRIARAFDAELVLTHVVSAPELTGNSPPEPEDMELREGIVRRNTRAANAHLDRVRRYIADQGQRVRVVCVRGDDARVSLARLVQSEGADLVVLSARGQGARRVSDMPHGTVTTYLTTHSPVPMLILQAGGRYEPPEEERNGRYSREPQMV